MKGWHTLTIAIASLLLLSGTVLAAVENPGTLKQNSSISLTPIIGGYVFSGSDALKPTVLYGLKMSYDIIGATMVDSLSIDGTVNYLSTTAKSGSDRADAYLFRIDAIYSLTPGRKLAPFIAVGLGDRLLVMNSKTENNPLLNYGAGVKYYFQDNLAVRVDARQLLVYKDVNTRSNFELSAGLTYYFDKEIKKPTAKIIPVIDEPKTPAKNFKEEEQEEESSPQSSMKPEPTVLEKLGGAGAAVVGISPGAGLFEPPPVQQLAAAPAFVSPEVIERQPSHPRTGQPSPRQAVTPGVAPIPSKAEIKRPSARMITAVTVEFDYAKDNIRSEYDKQIEVAAAMINSAAHSTVQIEAHTDNIGSSAENLALSIRRANSLKDILVKLGVDPRKITVKGYGFTKPLVENDTAVGRQKNRRAVAIINIQIAE